MHINAEHAEASQQAKLIEKQSHGECLHCTHSRTTKRDWIIFVEKMKEHHGVTVGAKYAPKRFYGK